MGLRARFLAALSRGEERATDPDAQVELDVVPLAQGPMLVAALQQEGIDAVGLEAFDVVTDTRSKMQITVRVSELARAHEVLERLR